MPGLPLRRTLLLLCACALAAGAATADPVEDAILATIDRELPRTVKLLERAVRIPSPTGDLAGVRRVGRLFERELRALGFVTRWERGRDLFAERRGTRGRRLLLIGHLDTVLRGGAWRREGSRGLGVGAADMKGGDVVIIAALRALRSAGSLDDTRIIVALMGDEEEPARPTDVSRLPLVAAARRSDAALAFELGLGSTATVARRGTALWRLEVTTRSGHSSGIFGAGLGSGAVFAAARILSRFHDELREPHLVYNPGLIVGGAEATYDHARGQGRAWGKSNVVAAATIVSGDLRFTSEAQRERAKERMRAIAAEALPDARAELVFDDGYPPMAASEGSRALLARLDEVSRDLGLPPITALDAGARGAGDASFVAPHVPVLDGLGAKGGRAHAADEWVDLASLPEQIKRAALLIHRLTR
jgi:glutamate carboxypeptidase